MGPVQTVSVVIRTFNEERHLGDLLRAVRSQKGLPTPVDVVVVDSGSTDRTLEIASSFGCRITHIQRSEFTFGRSLNRGCAFATGDHLVFVSGHCVPTDAGWLCSLTRPLVDGAVGYSYGRQLGGDESRFSECQLFEKYFPPTSRVPQEGFFCNNANAAMTRSLWERFQFDEELTGLEDMELAKRLVMSGEKVGYVAEAAVLHLHDETWRQVRNRYAREALALQGIMPQVHISFVDFLRYAASAIALDLAAAARTRRFISKAREIVAFRTLQYWGSYRGNNNHRKLSRKAKEEYFYPR